MQSERSLSCSQDSAIEPYPGPDESSPSPYTLLLKVSLKNNMSSTCTSLQVFRLQYMLFLVSTVPAICPNYTILFHLVTLITFIEEYKLLTSLCSFLHFPFASFVLGPNIFFSHP